MILHDVKVHPSKDNLKREDQLAWKIAAVAADKVPVRTRRRRDDRQPHHRQRRRRDRRDQPPSGGHRARHGARPSAQGRRHGVRRRARQARQSRMGRLGERHRGARARHARHLPAAGLLASRRQHPADPRGGADDGEIRPRPDPRHRHRLRDPHRPRPRDLPAQAQDRPHHPSLPRPGRRHRHAARAEAGRHLPGGAAGGACQLHHAPVAQRRDQLVEGLRAGACRQARGRGGGSRDARRRRAEPDL